MLPFSEAPWVINSRIIILIHSCFILSKIYEHTKLIGSGFPPTFGHIPPTSILIGWIGTRKGYGERRGAINLLGRDTHILPIFFYYIKV